MSETKLDNLSRRERQIMDIVYQLGAASAQEVQESMTDAPSYSSVRTLLGILIDKGHLRRVKQGLRYVYAPTTSQNTAARGELLRVLKTFFNGSVENAVHTLITEKEGEITNDELDRLAQMIEDARDGGS